MSDDGLSESNTKIHHRCIMDYCLFCGSTDTVEEYIYDAEEHEIEIPLYLCLQCCKNSDIPPIKKGFSNTVYQWLNKKTR